MAKLKVCEICGQEFLCKTNAKVCSDTCRKIYYQRASRKAYEASKTKYTCVKCGKDKFSDIPPEDGLCRHCRETHYQFKNQVTQKTLCKHCLKLLGSKTVNLTRPDSAHIIWKVCDDCKLLNYQYASDRMRLNNPSYFGESYSEEEYQAKKEFEARVQLYKQSEEYKQNIRNKLSERMRMNNPMRDEAVRLKGVATRKANVENGLIIQKRGIQHAAWKGNNNEVRNVLRRALKQWRIDNLERANYTCERCGKSHCQLHIHHKETFFDIVNKCAEKLQIDIKTLNVVDPKTNDYNKDFILLETAVVNYHKNNPDLGIVVCLDCHDIIDPQFRKPYRKKAD